MTSPLNRTTGRTTGRIRIVHIEDNPDIQELVAQILDEDQYELISVGTALEGIRVAGDLLPAMVLMDVELPDMDGLTATMRLRSMPRTKSIPVIVFTASVQPADKDRAYAAGASGFVAKPIKPTELRAEIQRYLGGARESIADPRREVELSHELAGDAAAQLEKQLRALEHITKLKYDFLRLAGHELRTPLTIISGHTDMIRHTLKSLRAALGEQAGVVTELDEMNAQVAAIGRAVEQFKLVSSSMLLVYELGMEDRLLDAEPVELFSIARGALKRRADRTSRAGRQLTMEFEPPTGTPSAPDAWTINGDAVRIEQALDQLISNAVKATHDGGHVVVRLAHAQDAHGRPCVDLQVVDDGTGVPPEKQELIFEPGFVLGDINHHSTSGFAFEGGGVGLGLAIVKSVAALHGGRSWVDSPGYDREHQPGPGSVFHLLLPVKPNTGDAAQIALAR